MDPITLFVLVPAIPVIVGIIHEKKENKKVAVDPEVEKLRLVHETQRLEKEAFGEVRTPCDCIYCETKRKEEAAAIQRQLDHENWVRNEAKRLEDKKRIDDLEAVRAARAQVRAYNSFRKRYTTYHNEYRCDEYTWEVKGIVRQR